MQKTEDAQRAASLRRYCKLKTALTEVCEALKVIKENAFLPAEIEQLSKNSDELDYLFSNTLVVSLTTYLNGVDSTSQVLQSYESKKFKDGDGLFNKLFKYPVVADASLEQLAFIHRSCANMNVHTTKIDMAVTTNERLEFLGDSWIGALVSYILFKKYPYANEGALSKMRSAIVNNVNLVKWCKKVGFDERLQANIPKKINRIKDSSSKYHADCFEAYIGALVLDRYSAEFSEITQWIEGLASEIFDEMGTHMVANPMNRNAKHELSQLLLQNKAGAQLAYHRLNSSSPFKVEVKLGDISLAIGEGSSIREAEQRAAMNALVDTSKIKTYSLYEIEEELAESFKEENKSVLLETNSEQKSLTEPKASASAKSAESQSATQFISLASDENSSQTLERAPGGISQTQMADIVEVITAKLKDTVLSTVTAVLRDSGSQLQPTTPGSPRVPAAQAKEATETAIPDYSVPKATTQLRPAATEPPIIESRISPSASTAWKPFLDAIAQTSTEIQSVPISALTSTSQYSKPLSTQTPPTSASHKFPSDLTGKLPYSCGALPVDSSSKQKLYAFLGPRGCKPCYKTETIALQTFSSSCMIEGFSVVLGTGIASSKKQAEQIAAHQALQGEELKEFLLNPSAFSLDNV